MYTCASRRWFLWLLPGVVITLMLVLASVGVSPLAHAMAEGPAEQAFQQSASEFGVPENLLKALCYMEGRFSTHAGTPSADGGYGCNLTKNQRVDTLDRAALKLGVSSARLEHDLPTNIRGAAYILSQDALQLAPSHTLPSDLAGWQEALELYSNSRSPDTDHLYADEVYTLLNQGFSASTDQGEAIAVAPQTLSAQLSRLVETDTAAMKVTTSAAGNLPSGCRKDGKTDYSGAIDCIVPPAQHDCDLVPGVNSPCNYFSSSHYGPGYRQNDNTITHVVIHDSEGSGLSALNAFEDPRSNVSSHYVIDSDGTVYQVVREKDVAFQAGNLWYNQHSIGIEHAGYDATGFLWYNATMYLASAKLVAYLLKKYHIPADHDHLVSHGTIPAITLAGTPNHVDPGPYWLWDYYLNLIRRRLRRRGTSSASRSDDVHIITLHPPTDARPFGPHGTETPANFNFFYLYNRPSTQSGLIPQEGTGADITDETNSVGPDMSYYYIKKVRDAAGSGDTMYEIWYGESDQAHASKPSFYTHARLAWLAVPPQTVSSGNGTAVRLVSTDGSPIQVSGKPGANTAAHNYYIGNAPSGSIFVSGYTAIEDGTHNVWYEINYNHRQAWVPASHVMVLKPSRVHNTGDHHNRKDKSRSKQADENRPKKFHPSR